MCKKCDHSSSKKHHKKKCDCKSKPQPPTNTLISIDGENCIACEDKKVLCEKQDLNKYLEALSYDDLCNKYINPPLDGYTGIVNPSALTYTLNPPLNVPPGQKGYNMVPHYPPITNPLPISGKNVLVIGAAKNLGKAIAEMFVNNGANVVGTSRFPECYNESFNYPLLKLDARITKDVKHFFEKLMCKHFTNGKIDILVNLPAIHTNGTLEESNGDDLLDVFNHNICTYQRITYYALPHMKFSNDTRVISFGSVAGELITPLIGYSISKRALQAWNDGHMAEALQRKAQGLSTFEPTFTLVEPGFIESTIGLYEVYTMKDTDIFNVQTRGNYMAFKANQSATTVFVPALACPQDPPPPPFIPPFSTCPCPSVPELCANVPELVAEAIHQIVMAPQPSIRYLIDADPSTNGLIQAANALSADEFLNFVYPSQVQLYLGSDTVALGQAILKDSFCK